MQILANLVFGAILAGLSLGPAAWSEAAALNTQLSSVVMEIAGMNEAAAPLTHAVARVRGALPHLPNGSH